MDGYICRFPYAGTRPSWLDWSYFSGVLGELPGLHGDLHLGDPGVSLLDSSCLGIDDFLRTQVVGLLLGWGMPFCLHFEDDPTWMQVGLFSSRTIVRSSRHETCCAWGETKTAQCEFEPAVYTEKISSQTNAQSSA